MSLEEMLQFEAKQFAVHFEKLIPRIEQKIMNNPSHTPTEIHELHRARKAVKRAGTYDGKSCPRCWVYDDKASKFDAVGVSVAGQYNLRCSVCANTFNFTY